MIHYCREEGHGAKHEVMYLNLVKIFQDDDGAISAR